MNNKNLRRISILVTAQTAHNLERLAMMDRTNVGRVVDKLTRDRMMYLKKTDSRPQEAAGKRLGR